MMNLEPVEELVSSADSRYFWCDRSTFPAIDGSPRKKKVWYVALPLTSAHRGSHSGGGATLAEAGDQSRYANEGTVYPHASLIEMITYQEEFFPAHAWEYIDLSHVGWETVQERLAADPPDVVAMSVYSATATWSLILAAELKRVKPDAVVVLGNDHAGILHREILTGDYGSRIVDFVSTGNNGPFTMMALLAALDGMLPIEKVPSIAYRKNGEVVNQSAPTYPLNLRILPDYKLIERELEAYYDPAFAVWYSAHYDLKRMVTFPIDSGCNWGSRPGRRCRHCSIQGLTPKVSDAASIVSSMESLVGDLKANIYAAGDSTLGMSKSQWGGNFTLLDDLASACSESPVLRDKRFLLAYGLVYEFLQSAELCKGFVRTWNVGIESFDPKLLKGNSKGINKGPDRIYEALELAKELDYKLYLSGILGLPGTTMEQLRKEVDNWLAIAETYAGQVTTISVAAPAIIPGSRMYFDSYNSDARVREWHGELLQTRRLSELYVEQNTEVTLKDVEAALAELGRGVIALDNSGANIKFGGYMMGGVDDEEAGEMNLLNNAMKFL
ncbi:B12-binding domain-containing radical SAM protein [Streptomyces sp. 061-3]|uniref:B12-binding domain-containing radical SAM protein n=1 Tax=Streptomyces sp. 061-3 TaxID=2789268 RepID=UPI00397EDF0E